MDCGATVDGHYRNSQLSNNGVCWCVLDFNLRFQMADILESKKYSEERNWQRFAISGKWLHQSSLRWPWKHISPVGKDYLCWMHQCHQGVKVQNWLIRHLQSCIWWNLLQIKCTSSKWQTHYLKVLQVECDVWKMVFFMSSSSINNSPAPYFYNSLNLSLFID